MPKESFPVAAEGAEPIYKPDETLGTTLVEQAVVETHSHSDKLKVPTYHPNNTDREVVAKLRKDLEGVECYQLYRQYAQGTVPTISMFEDSSRMLGGELARMVEKEKAEKVPETELQELTKKQAFIEHRAAEIKTAINRYVRVVIRFHNLKRLQEQRGNVDDLDRLQAVDKDRRRAHDLLLEALSSFTDVARALQEEGVLERGLVVEWKPGMNAQTLSGSGKRAVVFSPDTIKDRDYIRDWAVVADLDQYFSLAEKKLAEEGLEV